jgi:hypothetical protein
VKENSKPSIVNPSRTKKNVLHDLFFLYIKFPTLKIMIPSGANA